MAKIDHNIPSATLNFLIKGVSDGCTKKLFVNLSRVDKFVVIFSGWKKYVLSLELRNQFLLTIVISTAAPYHTSMK